MGRTYKYAKLDLNIPRVFLAVEGTNRDALNALAEQIAGIAKVNITKNDQVDTGFMLNTVAAMPVGSHGTPERVEHLPDKNGTVQLRVAPAMEGPSDDQAAVGVAAEYAIYQEVRDPFLYPAARAVARGTGARTISSAARKNGIEP